MGIKISLRSYSIILQVAFVTALAGCSTKSDELDVSLIDFDIVKSGVIDDTVPEQVVGFVGDQAITESMLHYHLARNGLGSRSNPLTLESVQDVLDQLAAVQAKKLAALDAGLDNDTHVQSLIDNLLASSYQQKVQQQNRSLLQVSKADVESYYLENIQEFTASERRRLAIVAIFHKSDATPMQKQEALNLAGSIQKKANSDGVKGRFFGDLAAKHSHHTNSKFRQGDLGWILQGSQINGIEKIVLDKAFELNREHEASVVEGERGVYVIRLAGIEPSKTSTLGEVQREIEKRLQARKLISLERQSVRRIHEKHPIRFDKERLEQIVDSANQLAARSRNAGKPPSFPVEVPTK